MAIRPKDLELNNQQRNELMEMHGRAAIHLKQFPSGTIWTYSHRPAAQVITAFIEIWRQLGWDVDVQPNTSGLQFLIRVPESVPREGG